MKETPIDVTDQVGYGAIAGLVFAESAGVPLPGGTALLTAGVLAASGKLDLALVVGVATCAALAGSSGMYWIGRKAGAHLLAARGPIDSRRRRAFNRGHELVGDYGSLAVAVNPIFPVVPNYAPLITGSLRMPWPSFLLWATVGIVAWVMVYTIPGFLVGRAAGTTWGLTIVLGGKLVISIVAIVAYRFLRRKRCPSNGAIADSD